MRNGFTLIELVIVSAVIMFLTGGVISNFQGFNDREKVNQAMANLKQNLRVAQTKALSGEKPAGCTTLIGYKVTFTGTNYSVQAVCSNGDIGPITSVTLPNGITFSSVPSPITFGGVSKGVTNPQTIILEGSSTTTQITVSSSGLIADVLP